MPTGELRSVQRNTADLPEAALSMLDTLYSHDMLRNVKRLGIALSGGADSLALLECFMRSVLCERAISAAPFVLHIDQYGQSENVATVAQYVKDRYNLPLHVFEADTKAVAESLVRRGKAPCRGCSPVRARALAAAASDLSLDAIALGHHMTDALATLLMNMFHKGSLETMRPIAYRRYDLRVPILRPFYFTEENIVKSASPVGTQGLFTCGMCSLHASERARAHAFVTETFVRHKPSVKHGRQVLEKVLSNEDQPTRMVGKETDEPPLEKGQK